MLSPTVNFELQLERNKQGPQAARHIALYYMSHTDEVFGIATKPVLSYVERDAVDAKFKKALLSNHHMVLYGSSKQGKTSLRQKYIPDADCVIVHCGPKTTTEQIYSSVLRQANVRIQTVETSVKEVGGKVNTKIGFKATIPWFAATKVETGGEVTGRKQDELTEEFIAFDFGEAQSISELLERIKFRKFIILENFHYLLKNVQQALAFDLKTFHEVNIRFIILGIWWEANHLITFNGDLQDRILEIPVEPWIPGDFARLANKGSELLNVKILPAIVDYFIKNSFGNVGIMQEFLKTFCHMYGVDETKDEVWDLKDEAIAKKALDEKALSQRDQLLKTLQIISGNSRVRSNEQDPLLLPYYLTLVICNTPIEQLVAGIERTRLLQLLREVHHRDKKETIRPGDLTNLLTRIPALQEGVQPPFLYYDSNNRRLRLVDARHFFVLANINRGELAEEIPYPRENGD